MGRGESIRDRPGRRTCAGRFCLARISANAETLARAVRGPWAIEQTRPGSLAGRFAEDQCRGRSGCAAENRASRRHLSIQILKGETTKKRGLKGKPKNAGWDHSYLLNLLRF